jgi:hypothetical protein
MIQTRTTTNPPTAAALESDWRSIGFTEGAPPHVPAALVASDVRIYRNGRCSACGHGGQAVKPFHKRREYRLLCSCRSCGAGSEA